jgi:hypothetical protein
MGVLIEDAYLQLPPQPIAPNDVLLPNLVEAWEGDVTTALAISNALSTKVGKALPWVVVRDGIDGAFRTRLLERAIDSGPWPCDYAGARAVKITVPQKGSSQPGPVTPPPPKIHETRLRTFVAEASLEIEEIQNLNDQLAELTKAAVGLNLSFYFRVELGTNGVQQIPETTIAKFNELLAEVSEKLLLHWE